MRKRKRATEDATAFERGQQLNWTPVNDAEGADLGDRRLDARLINIVSGMMRAPSQSLPEIFPSNSELTAAYRFTDNEKFGWRDIIEPHVQRTAERARLAGRVLIIHDTTDVRFEMRDGYLREHLGQVASRTQGLYLHTSLVTTGDGLRCPLGVLRVQPFVHQSELRDAKAIRYWKREGGLYDNERSRWKQAIVETQKLLAGVEKAVHVGDRESDLYEVVCHSEKKKVAYVLRVSGDRAVVREEDSAVRFVSDALNNVPWQQQQRMASVSGRTASRSEKDKKEHPVRAPRDAVLSFRATRIEMRRPLGTQASSGLPASQSTNFVEVRELKPPPGEEPIRWVLMTSEPIATQKDIVQVVDDYRSRWAVEEFFKGLKTGCALEERQADSAASLLKLIGLSAPIAAHLLLLRYLHRHQPDLPASLVFSEKQIALLRAEPKAHLRTEQPTIGAAIDALAEMGGHRKNNGPPGWLILSRAYAKLLEREIGWYLALAALQKRQ